MDATRRAFCVSLAACAAGLVGCRRGTSCDDPAQISQASRDLRRELAYVPRTLRPGQLCRNCAHYKPPPGDRGDACGGCRLFSGPVTADGWCKEWVAGASNTR
jgi:hypothetical protein